MPLVSSNCSCNRRFLFPLRLFSNYTEYEIFKPPKWNCSKAVGSRYSSRLDDNEVAKVVFSVEILLLFTWSAFWYSNLLLRAIWFLIHRVFSLYFAFGVWKRNYKEFSRSITFEFHGKLTVSSTSFTRNLEAFMDSSYERNSKHEKFKLKEWEKWKTGRWRSRGGRLMKKLHPNSFGHCVLGTRSRETFD